MSKVTGGQKGIGGGEGGASVPGGTERWDHFQRIWAVSVWDSVAENGTHLLLEMWASRVQDQEEVSLEEAFKLGPFITTWSKCQQPLSVMPQGPHPTREIKSGSGSCSISLKIRSWETVWSVIKGKVSLL